MKTDSSILPDAPLVSVIMNCYNGEKYLPRAIESVLNQSYQNWEFIFWDNQSTDKSSEIFKSYSDQRLNYFYASTHTLLSEARNQAVLKSQGVLVAFLDVDDYWLPNKLEHQVSFFVDPQVGMSCGNYILVNERTNKKHKIQKAALTKTLASGYVLNDLLSDYFVHFSTLIVRRRALTELEYLFDRRFSVIHDFDFVIRLSLNWKLSSLQEPIAIYRWHDTNYGFTSKLSISDEFNLWYEDAKLIPSILKCPGFKDLIRKIRWYKITKLIYEGDRCQVLFELTGISIYKKIKALIAIMLPFRFVKKWIKRR